MMVAARNICPTEFPPSFFPNRKIFILQLKGTGEKPRGGSHENLGVRTARIR